MWSWGIFDLVFVSLYSYILIFVLIYPYTYTYILIFIPIYILISHVLNLLIYYFKERSFVLCVGVSGDDKRHLLLDERILTFWPACTVFMLFLFHSDLFPIRSCCVVNLFQVFRFVAWWWCGGWERGGWFDGGIMLSGYHVIRLKERKKRKEGWSVE